jgi:hypothetical protein
MKKFEDLPLRKSLDQPNPREINVSAKVSEKSSRLCAGIQDAFFL